MSLQKNISGELTQEVLEVGYGAKVSSISLVNTHASITCTVDMYIEKKLFGRFYLAKNIALPVGVILVIDELEFNTGDNGFGLFIKLTKGASETPVVDLIIK
tara:strand:- start:428 stop:733 length:306 start_codon:yes stop_codon:yes gene_type:complete